MRTPVPLVVKKVEQDIRRRTRGNGKTCRKGNESGAGSVAGMKVSLGACFPSFINRHQRSINSTPPFYLRPGPSVALEGEGDVPKLLKVLERWKA